MIVVVLAGVIAWVAAGSADEADEALDRVIPMASSVAALAEQVQTTNDALVVATGSAGEAVSYNVVVSQQVRALIDALDDVQGVSADQAKAIDAVRNALGEAEASLLETEGGLGEANVALSEASTTLADVVLALQAVPDQLDDVASSTSGGGATWLWRISIVLVALVLLWILYLLSPTSASAPHT